MATVERGAEKSHKSEATCPWGRKINSEDSELIRLPACQKSYTDWPPLTSQGSCYEKQIKVNFLV